MRTEFNIQPEAFAFEAEPSEFEAWEMEAPRNRGSAPYIRWLQAALNQVLGLRLAVDGMMGPQTRSAVRSFQRKQGLTADGVVGPRTEAALVKAGSGAAAGPVPTPLPNPYRRKLPTPLPNPYKGKLPTPLPNPYKQPPVKRCTDKAFDAAVGYCRRSSEDCEKSCTSRAGVIDSDCEQYCKKTGDECVDQVKRNCGRK